MKLHNPFKVKETVGLCISIMVVLAVVIVLVMVILSTIAHTFGIKPFGMLVIISLIAAFSRVGYAIIKGK